MSRYVVMLRGINVGGKNMLPMPALRAALTDAGFGNVATYIQSGNVVLDAPGLSEPEVVARVEQVITDRFSLTVPTVVRSDTEMQRVAESHPFLAADTDVSTVAVLFLGEVPSPEAVASLDPNRSPPDVFRVIGREIVMVCPTTFAKTKLTIDYFERRLRTRATARNWRTVQTLAAMSR